MSAPTPPQIAGQPTSWIPLILGGCTLSALSIIAVVSYLKSQPVIEEVEVDQTQHLASMQRVLKEGETKEGKKVEVYVWEAVENPRTVKVKQTIQHKLSPEQQTRLYIFQWTAILVGLSVAGMMVVWLKCHWSGKEVPKQLDTLLTHSFSAGLGAVLTFIGMPAATPTQTQPTLPSVSSKLPPPAPAPQPPM